MIALFSRYGQTGNRLVINIHALATALATGQSYFSFFGKEIIDLSGVSHVYIKNNSVRFLPITADAIPFRAIGKIRELLASVGFRNNAETLHDINPDVFTPGRLHVLTDWFQRNPTAVKAEAAYIQSTLAFAEKHRVRTDSLFGSPNTLFVGVHIRRTDYREWQGGAYFWSDQVYRWCMDSFVSQMPEQSILFLIASDETIQRDTFLSNRFGTFFLQGSSFEDMCALSRCDYVMGPRSSFSRVAAFLGNTRYHQIEGEGDPCDPLSFVLAPIP